LDEAELLLYLRVGCHVIDYGLLCTVLTLA
jgi:hypothetical protein